MSIDTWQMIGEVSRDDHNFINLTFNVSEALRIADSLEFHATYGNNSVEFKERLHALALRIVMEAGKLYPGFYDEYKRLMDRRMEDYR